jgi:DNA-binding FadR family transcriptional regulator
MLGIGAEAHRRLSSRRTAEIVADELRQQIVDGRLRDGDLLPGQKQLVEYFNVSLVSVREALRILETEGLVSVRRGNRGGAVVHAPRQEQCRLHVGAGAAERFGSRHRSADRARRARTVLRGPGGAPAGPRQDPDPQLISSNEALAENLDDPDRFSEIGREFHHLLALGCVHHAGGDGQPRGTVDQPGGPVVRSAKEGNIYPTLAKRRSALSAHIKLTEAIADGDVDRARRLARKHIAEAHTHASTDSDQRIRAHSPQVLTRRAEVN